MATYKYIINPHTGKLQKVLDSESISVPENETDLDYEVTHQLYVDGNRTDTYTPDGSIAKPYKTIQDAIDSAPTTTQYNRCNITIFPGNYDEQITMKKWVHLTGWADDSVFIESSDGDVITSSVDANIANVQVSYQGSDSSKVAIKLNSSAYMVFKNSLAFSYNTAIEVNSSAILMMHLGGTLTSGDSIVVKGGAYAFFNSCSLSGWTPGYDLKIESGAYVDAKDLELFSNRLSNAGTLNLLNPASLINNDSSVSGDTVKDALENINASIQGHFTILPFSYDSIGQGTYTLILFGKTHTAYGIIDVDIDGDEIASFDLYGANTDNVRQVQTGITVSSAGIKTLKLRVDGKNASSSAYYCAFTYLALIKTA